MQGSPIGDENSTKVRGLTTEQAINSAETMMRFVRAAAARGPSGSDNKGTNSEMQGISIVKLVEIRRRKAILAGL